MKDFFRAEPEDRDKILTKECSDEVKGIVVELEKQLKNDAEFYLDQLNKLRRMEHYGTVVRHPAQAKALTVGEVQDMAEYLQNKLDLDNIWEPENAIKDAYALGYTLVRTEEDNR